MLTPFRGWGGAQIKGKIFSTYETVCIFNNYHVSDILGLWKNSPGVGGELTIVHSMGFGRVLFQ